MVGSTMRDSLLVVHRGERADTLPSSFRTAMAVTPCWRGKLPVPMFVWTAGVIEGDDPDNGTFDVCTLLDQVRPMFGHTSGCSSQHVPSATVDDHGEDQLRLLGGVLEHFCERCRLRRCGKVVVHELCRSRRDIGDRYLPVERHVTHGLTNPGP